MWMLNNPKNAPGGVVLRFTPQAWEKVVYLRDNVDTEISMIGISSEDDPLVVEDIRVVKQMASSVETDIDDEAICEHLQWCVESGIGPHRGMRIFLHTHPGNSASPSQKDEEKIWKAAFFKHHPWYIMFIVSRGGEVYTRMRRRDPEFPIVQDLEIQSAVDYSLKPEEWREPLDTACETLVLPFPKPAPAKGGGGLQAPGFHNSYGNGYGNYGVYSDSGYRGSRSSWGKSGHTQPASGYAWNGDIIVPIEELEHDNRKRGNSSGTAPSFVKTPSLPSTLKVPKHLQPVQERPVQEKPVQEADPPGFLKESVLAALDFCVENNKNFYEHPLSDEAIEYGLVPTRELVLELGANYYPYRDDFPSLYPRHTSSLHRWAMV